MPIRRTTSFTDLIDMMKDVSIRSTLSTTRRTSSKSVEPTGPSTELSLDDFEQFLSKSLYAELGSGCEGVSQLFECLDMDCYQDTLALMEVGLLSILRAYPSLSSPVVGEIHSYLGLVYLELGNYTSAVDAFMKAIWFQSRTPAEENAFAIAQANHRLGMAYGLKKQFRQAVELLDGAIAAYDPSSENYVRAKEDRHAFQEAEQLALLAKTRPQAIRRGAQRTKSGESNASSRQRGSRRHQVKRTASSASSSRPGFMRQKTV